MNELNVIGGEEAQPDSDNKRRRAQQADRQPTSPGPPKRQRSHSNPSIPRSVRKGKHKSRTNYRHYPADDPTLPQSFSMALSRPPPEFSPSPELTNNPEGDVYGMQHPLPLVASAALAATSPSLLPAPPPPQAEAIYEQLALANDPEAESLELTPAVPLNDSPSDDHGQPFNLSEYGLVHLPPLPTSGAANSGTDSEYPGSSTKGSSEQFYSVGSHSVDTDSSNPAKKRRRLLDSRQNSSNPSSSSNVAGSNDSGSLSNRSSEEPIVTFQFQHVEDENGHHVVVGREGQLQRCEDEPIHTPGAVQGFGVLIAVQDVDDSVLVVRQVSEVSAYEPSLGPMR